MYVGFHDDADLPLHDEPQPRCSTRRASANATIVRTLVDWSKTAPTRPANAADPFDPAYRLNDIDELVRNAQARGHGGAASRSGGRPSGRTAARRRTTSPDRMSDLTSLLDGRRGPLLRPLSRLPLRPALLDLERVEPAALPDAAVRRQGRSVAPRLYAKLAAAAYAGIKAGNPRAQVAIGETSSARPRQELNGNSDTHSPGRFAQLVAAANPRLKFDAWAHHPYPTPRT